MKSINLRLAYALSCRLCDTSGLDEVQYLTRLLDELEYPIKIQLNKALKIT